MSNVTKEWLQKTIAELEEERDAVPGVVNEDAAMALAAMKLALSTLEAEPVAYIFKHPAGRLFWSLTDESNKGQSDVMPVYTAQPAPVFVPDELTREEYDAVMDDDDFDDTFRGGWKAHRAAMLKGAEHVSNRDELPDGWVACSERMPEDEQQVITHNIFGYRHISFFDEHSGHFFDHLDGRPIDCVEHVLVSHWMTLPAAPQQEVKP
ncbi:hypothetical protein AWS32_21095 [Enterobacter hormaechei subsp. xiangfangensis]|uniref:DUF551 domain-containing protein n=1 Tax=Enterobacter hormaechei TaxID=158836 RepID=UPI0006284498|nr:DUF551 domain-containing protein [Enterobacter hormaechei]KKO88539.1 hypothetical protein TN43_24915 [Enterobacter hormaechei]KTG79455.1 hypothetical protein ASV38_20910 [Enterobacter hormaechei subsp. xiangfangensis]KVJ46104.1 hypothetical protein AWS32_21095 [Enterobacter hormaechei subsp. xiangfangensis]CZV09876.1 Protein of uncharacterised function (DUF551) [Enterobacter hormaechei]SAE47552.1 Protein of uncharacterised function (DUF551) [Enterobacter hormaechei]